MVDYPLMNQTLYEGRAPQIKEMAEQALAGGREAQEVLQEGLIAGMSVVGEDFKHNRLYVPQVLIAARAMKSGMAVLKPLLTAGGNMQSLGTVVMGTVKGGGSGCMCGANALLRVLLQHILIQRGEVPVSYTHLTLPTILLV